MKYQNISIDVNIVELLEQIKTEYLLDELENRTLFYLDIMRIINDKFDKEELVSLKKKKEISKIIKFKD